jgi:hypothetical protein
MAQNYGGKIVTNGLVLCLDAHDAKSYPGEPSTNYVPWAHRNGRFNASSDWGTYNTNQYNGNAYFSIGGIDSITDNIITTTSPHPLRTYDVVTPETTSGGVYAGTRYFVRKLSSTTFTLHAYNGAQDGTVGYINPTTGKHKVHDSIWLDQRISAFYDAFQDEPFPPNWWGPPHESNSGLVKELVVGGGRIAGTNCMRLHHHRDDNVVDGMAYGVYTPVTVGDTITVSVWIKISEAGYANSRGFSYSTYFGGASGFGISNLYPTTEWQLYEWTWVASATYSFYSYWWPDASSIPYYIDMADFQVELNKGYSTPFVEGVAQAITRSTTNAWLDRSGNENHGTLNGGVVTGGSHYISGKSILPLSNAYLKFDGVDDYVNIPYTSGLDTPNGCTYDIWIYPLGIAGEFLSRGTSDATDNPRFYVYANGNLYVDWSDSPTDKYMYSSANCNLNDWNHVVGIFTPGGTIIIYLNGSDVSGTHYGTNLTNPLNNTPNDIQIGGCTWVSRYFTGRISSVKVYNRALTATEVLNNYNSQKGKFGL